MLQTKHLYAVISGILTIIAFFELQPWLGAIALVPLLYVLTDASLKDNFKITTLFAITIGFGFFYWIPSSAGVFSGQWLTGLMASLLFVLLFVGHFLLVFISYHYLKKEEAFIQNALLLAALMVLVDYLRYALFATMPWLHFHFGNILLGSVYTLQLAEFGGLYLLTFSLVFFNALITAVVKKQFPLTYLGIYLCIFLLINVSIYLYRSATPKGREVKLNLLTENIDPRLKWEEEGNAVVGKLINLSKQAAQNPAAINIWTETVIPWTYSANDDFLGVILRHTQQTNALTLIGMNTELGKNEVYDSAYLLTPTAEVLGRYDKNYPLAVIESKSSILPRGHNRGTTVAKSNDAMPIVTPQGKIGVLICNEATVPYLANTLVAKGAHFLVNMSNDGWFAQSYIPTQHFYYNRLRAVETRRDVVVNSNMGYRGVFTSNGDEVVYQPMGVAALEQVTVHQKTGLTLYNYFPWLMLVVSIILITIHKYNHK